MKKNWIKENHFVAQTGKSGAGEDRLLTISEVSQLTGLAVGSLYHLASDGRIPTTRLSKRCLRFRLSALKRWWEERSEYPAPEHEKVASATRIGEAL